MTLEEINLLKIKDYKKQMSQRLWDKFDPRPDKMPKFTAAELKAEFKIYKAELIDIENEKVRRKDLEDRFENLKDMRGAFHNLHNEPNPALWLKGLLLKDKDLAESEMKALETKDIELQPTQSEIDKKVWISDIENELSTENITKDGLLEALVRKEFLGDTSLVDALKPKIVAINKRKPRP